jgi:hypothetical protein
MKTACLLLLVAYATAECPNACSGHGTCGSKDSCSCYNGFQSNDCSEKSCYFGIAHVDTPKGDLNADGMVSGPLTTVITGSEVYPWGTTEQYPNADANEGHFYMECSNKGICDRKQGTCDCFDGYEGTACVRASCPNDCSGHGTCETIKELAEMKGYDTNGADVPTTTPVGATTSGTTGNHDFDLAIEESYAYDLWDQDKTMGCKCDPVYYGADCSLKKCKYGVDPLFYDDTDGRIYQTTVIHLGSRGQTSIGKISGTFNIVFYDVFGEKYSTKAIQADPAETSALKVQEALEALPNGVIARTHGDVTFEASGEGITKTPAVEVSKQGVTGTLTRSGCIGAGTAYTSSTPTGVGLGVLGHGTLQTSKAADSVASGAEVPTAADSQYGPEFTITFSTNPGILKTIELDTRQVTNPGTTDYWVANSRQGQFQSRYSTNLGRINTLRYGSKLLYTNTDLQTSVGVTASAKCVGGTAEANPYVVVEGTAGTACTGGGGAYTAAVIGAPLKVGGQEFGVTAESKYALTLSEPFLGTSIIPVLSDTGSKATALASAQLSMVTSAAGKITALTVGDFKTGAKLYVNGCPITSAQAAVAIDAHAITIETDNDCWYDALPSGADGDVVYRRTDDPNNQNVYATESDTSALLSDGFCTSRGSADIYPCAAVAAGSVVGFVKATNIFTFSADVSAEAGFGAAATFFVNGLGPMRISAVTTTAVTTVSDDLDGEAGADYFESFDAAAADTLMPAYKVGTVSANDAVAANSILLMDGRRYKVASVGNTLGGTSNGKITLTETYAGGMILEECAACVTTSAAATNVVTLTTTREVTRAVGEGFMVGGYANINLVFGAFSAATDKALIINRGGKNGHPLVMYAFASKAKALYRVLNGMGYRPYHITEAVAGSTYQYVSQCSNRGACDSSSGICKCFKGYSNDNCDNQNMLAM